MTATIFYSLPFYNYSIRSLDSVPLSRLGSIYLNSSIIPSVFIWSVNVCGGMIFFSCTGRFNYRDYVSLSLHFVRNTTCVDAPIEGKFNLSSIMQNRLSDANRCKLKLNFPRVVIKTYSNTLPSRSIVQLSLRIWEKRKLLLIRY